ncbi:MAG: aminotransferase class IV [Aquificota bacterium]|nr:aminotransferase class IV [Aquificota bacterium]
MNRSLLYGEGLFETILWRGETRKLLLHYRRLRRSAEQLGIPCPGYSEFLKAIEEKTGGRRDLYVKFLLFSEGPDHFGEKPSGYTVRVVVRPLPKVPLEVSLTLSPYRRHSGDPVARHKTTSYLFNVLVRREARSRGFYDGVVLNEKDHVTECSASNVLVLKGEKLYTPAVESGLLRGTTLEVISAEMGVEEAYITPEDLISADSVFITNSLIGVAGVVKIGDTAKTVDADVLEEIRRAVDRFNTPQDT